MPWRGASEPGEYPTIGYEVIAFIESHCAIPDGDHQSEPFILTDEMYDHLLRFYRVDPETGRWFYERGSQLVRPQKWGKGPFSAAWVCAEAEGPVLFDGWDANGEPVGRPWATPWIQVTAVSEDQTDNVWRALVPMIELGSLKADIPDTGETRINLPGGGRIEPVTSSARSRLGQRLTAAVQDETHSWLERNGGRKLADNQRRNLAGMGGRFMETTNAWDPTEQSVAQMTHDSPKGVYVDYPVPPAGSVRNKRERRKVMRFSYGDSWWVTNNLERVDLEVEALLEHDPVQAERFFLNRAHAGESLAFDAARWARLAKPKTKAKPKALITVGARGERFSDSIGLIATDVATGLQWPLGIWEIPKTADDDYEHPAGEITGALYEAAEGFDLWRCYVDLGLEFLRERWAGKLGEKKVVVWDISRPKAAAYAVRAYRQAQAAGELYHNGDKTFSQHIANARKRAVSAKDDEGRPMWTIQKERPGSPLFIDGAWGGTLSWEARGDAIAAGALEKKSRRTAFV